MSDEARVLAAANWYANRFYDYGQDDRPVPMASFDAMNKAEDALKAEIRWAIAGAIVGAFERLACTGLCGGMHCSYDPAQSSSRDTDICAAHRRTVQEIEMWRAKLPARNAEEGV